MPDQPIVQISTPIRQGDVPQVVVRANSLEEVDEAVDVLNAVTAYVAPLMKSAAMAMMSVPASTAQAIGNLQNAGLGPHVVEERIGTPVGPAGTSPLGGQCPACNKSTACTQCNGATRHTTKHSTAKNQDYNVHECVENNRHKVTWCTTPLPGALRSVLGNTNLVYKAA